MQFDGHYWVERNGLIIDPWFEEYRLIAEIHGCRPERRYLKCPNDVVGRVFLRRFENSIEYPVLMGLPPTFGNCLVNALKEIDRNGGQLVFGSLGFPRPDGSVHWEFGGDTWKTVKDFLKK